MTYEIEIKNVKIIRDFKVALKDLEPIVKNPQFLWNGRTFKNFKLRPREAWANWLVCIVLRQVKGLDITFMEDDVGDGFFVNKNTGKIVQTEHVCALDIPEGKKLPSGEQRVIDAINLKIDKGADYAQNKLLVVFFDGAGKFFRNKIRESIFGKHNFEAVFCVGLLDSSNNGYSYTVTEFRNIFGEQSITHIVKINNEFTDWQINQILQ